MSRDRHDKQHSNTAFRWGIVVGQPNPEHWRGDSKPDMSNVGLWVRAVPDHAFRTHDGNQIMCFNSEQKASDYIDTKMGRGSWNYEAKLIPKTKTVNAD